MSTAAFEVLQDAVIRPGIEKHLTPLLFYRGSLGPGRVHRLWNFAISMMLSEAQTFSEGTKLANDPTRPHLCEPNARTSIRSLVSFFSRLRDNPSVSDNYPGLTRYVQSVFGASGAHCFPFSLTRVPEIGVGDIAPWRIRRAPLPRGPKPLSDAERWRRDQIKREERARAAQSREQAQASLFYPFLIHKPKGDDGTFDLLVEVNNAVPKSLPEHVRADVCQDLVVAVLTGEIDRSELRGSAKSFLSKVFQMSDMKYGSLALNAPAPWDPYGRTLAEMI